MSYYVNADLYPELSALLNEFFEVANTPEFEGMTRVEILKTVMKRKHYWPDIQIRSFGDQSGLVLLSNTYNKKVEGFQALYDQCRSTVIDTSADAEEDRRIVLSIGSHIPSRITSDEYENMQKHTRPNVLYHLAMEGSYVYVYKHKDKWYFSTTGRPQIDQSRFQKGYSFGRMLDDALRQIAPEDVVVQHNAEFAPKSSEPAPVEEDDTEMAVDGEGETQPRKVRTNYLRQWLTSYLQDDKVYRFVLVHHRNSRYVPYQELFGAEYAKIFHVGTKDRVTLQELYDFALDIPGMERAEKFETYEAAKEALAKPLSYGIIAQNPESMDDLFMITKREIIQTEQENPGHTNPWMNMLAVYQQNKPFFQVRHYMEKYLPNWEPPLDFHGRPIQPVALLTTVFNSLHNILYQSYRYSTLLQNGRYRVIKHVDETLPACVRFHVSRLRNIQIGPEHRNKFLTPNVIYDYLCHTINLKDLRILIQYFATTGAGLEENTATAFSYLYRLLQD